MYVAIATPVFLAFTATDSPGKDFMELLVDVLFAIDIILHFRLLTFLYVTLIFVQNCVL